MKILIIGGAGYIGGVTTHYAIAAGHTVTVADDLSTGQAHNVPAAAAFMHTDIRDRAAVDALFAGNDYDAVMHFAAKILVPESMEKPFDYFETNTVAALNVIDAATKHGVKAYIFSSTAAVYGAATHIPLQETDPCLPVNPYGASKLLTEQILRSYQITHGLEWTALRYFNVGGAYSGVGTDYPFISHIIPTLLSKIKGHEPIVINGNDYGTPDGTAIRDYLHVLDLAKAHLTAAEKMLAGTQLNQPINLGSQSGYSVKQVADTFNEVTGANLIIEYGARRAGDPPELIASNERAKQLLGWQPEHDLKTIITDHYDWFMAKK